MDSAAGLASEDAASDAALLPSEPAAAKMTHHCMFCLFALYCYPPVVELQSHAGEASDEAELASEAAAAVVSSLFLRAAGAAVVVSSDTAEAAELDSAGGHTHSEAAEEASVEAAASDAPATVDAAS